MDSEAIANWTNSSESSRGGFNETVDDIVDKTPTDYTVAFCICLLGLPGNLLVLAVYVLKMSTSTRVYMFALAIADSAVCLCGVALTMIQPGFFVMNAVIFVFDFVTSFSVFLLVFVSIERLLAVRRPHSFTIKVARAKTALMAIAATAALYTTATKVANAKQLHKFNQVFMICTLWVCVITMTACYSLTAATLMRQSLNRIAVLARNRSAERGLSGMTRRQAIRTKTTTTTTHGRAFQRADEVTRSHLKINVAIPCPNGVYSEDEPTAGPSMPAAQFDHAMAPPTVPATFNNSTTAQTKNITLLFIVTVVFIACWLPKWMSTMGVPIPNEVRRSFVINSVVNPFIYCFASAMFREDVRQFCRGVRGKASRCLR